jgi:hypothetical protein
LGEVIPEFGDFSPQADDGCVERGTCLADGLDARATGHGYTLCGFAGTAADLLEHENVALKRGFSRLSMSVSEARTRRPATMHSSLSLNSVVTVLIVA